MKRPEIIAMSILAVALIWCRFALAQMTPDEALAAIKQKEATAATQPSSELNDLREAISAMRVKNADLEARLAVDEQTIKQLRAQLAKAPQAKVVDAPEGIFVGMNEADMLAYTTSHKWDFQPLSDSADGKVYIRSGGADGTMTMLKVIVIDGKISEIDGMQAMRK